MGYAYSMRVIAVLQSEGNDPVEMLWCRDAEDVDVLLSVAQILRHAKEQPNKFVPKHLEIRIEL